MLNEYEFTKEDLDRFVISVDMYCVKPSYIRHLMLHTAYLIVVLKRAEFNLI